MSSPHFYDIDKETPRFSEILRLIEDQAQQSNALSLGRLLEIVGPKGHSFISLFLVLPFLQPIPLVGLSTAIGLVIAMIGIFIIRDRPPYLPARLAKIQWESKSILKVCSVLERLMKRLERYIQPRGHALITQNWLKRLNGILIFFHAILMSLPLPIPLSNFLPASVLFLLSLGALEEDILVILLGYTMALINLAFFTSLVLLPYLGLRAFQL